MNRYAQAGLLAAALTAASAIAATRHASADDGKDQKAAAAERCANRLSISFTGKTATDPAATTDTYLASPDFSERFARFINSQFQMAPSEDVLEDAPYWFTKKILEGGRPWSDMFLGKLRLFSVGANVAVQDDDEGLGYFRDSHWYLRYEGNEENGIKLMTAYQIMNNVVGLKLTASTASPTTDESATGRQASPCNGCHYNGWFALDKVASILPKKGQSFDAYNGGPQEMLGGQQIDGDEALVKALVASENFAVNACRLSFQFLYAREDNHCDGPVLDDCVDAFKAQPKIQTALASIANQPGFCE